MSGPSSRPLPIWVPFGILAAAAAYLAVKWDAIPPSFAVHWDASGRVNGWSQRTPVGVFGPLLICAAALGFVESLFVATRRLTQGSAGNEPVRAATASFLRAMCTAIACVFSLLAIELPLGPHLPPVVTGAVILLFVGIALAWGAASMARALGQVRRAGHAAKVEGYRGLQYSNAKDSRLWVPKLRGGGWTVNFAHPWAWPVMVLLVGGPIVVGLLMAWGR